MELTPAVQGRKMSRTKLARKGTFMATRKLTIRLPEEDIDFARDYAAEHGMTMTELIDRYLKSLQTRHKGPLADEIVRFSGIIPADIDGRREYHEGMAKKHR